MAAQVDELGALEKEFAPLRPKLARIDALRKAIRAQFDSAPAASPFEAKGDKFIVLIGPRAMERSINPAKLIKAIGLKLYASIARLTLGDLEANVAPEIVAGVVTSANTGARSLKTLERGL
jgi:hypothetical protein